MNKLFKSIVAASVGVAMAIGVGVGVASREAKAVFATAGSLAVNARNLGYTNTTYSNKTDVAVGDEGFKFSTTDVCKKSGNDVSDFQLKKNTGALWNSVCPSGYTITSIELTNVSGGAVSVYKGSSANPSDSSVSGNNNVYAINDSYFAIKAGTTAGYFLLTINYDAQVSAKTLTSISLSGTYSTNFEQGDAFSHTGMVVTAHYDDSSTKDVSSSATFSGYDMSSVGTQEVTVSYAEGGVTKTTTYDIVVSTPAPINYGTLENPLTITQAKAVLNKTGAEFSAQPLFVRGIVSTNKAFNTTYDNAEIWLQSEDTLVQKDFQLYNCGIDSSIENTANLKVVDGLKDCDVVATGYGKVYYGTTTVYELTNTTINNNRINPSIVSLTRPALASVSLNKIELSLEVNESETLVASPNPTAALLGDVVWSSSDDDVAEVDPATGEVTAIAVGSATITATSSNGKSASCSVTVTNTSASVALPANGLTFNYDVLGLSTYTSYANNHNRSISVGNFAITLDPNSSDAVMKGTAPYNSANLGIDCMQFKKGPFEAIAITTKIEAAKKATVILYSWGHATQAPNYLPTFKIGASATSVVANETNGGTVNVTGVDTGISYTSTGSNPQTNNIYSYTLTYDLSSLSNEKLTFVTASGGATYIESIVIDNLDESSITPANYLSDASSYASLHGSENATSKIFDFTKQGYANQEVITEVSIDSNVGFVCAGTGDNVPSYWTNGESMHIYTGNTMTFNAENGSKIIKIEFTLPSSSHSSGLATTTGTLSNGVWNGEATSIEFTLNSQVRISVVKVTYYTGTYSVDNVSIRFGASISKTNWNNIKNHEGWSIADYGVMMVKKTTLAGYGENNTVEKAFRNKGASYVSIVNKTKNGAAYADPYLPDGGTAYSFTARLSFSGTTGFDTVVCARPFVKVGEDYFFLGDADIEFSVNSLASYYINNPTYMGGLSLTNKALTYLSTAH